MSKKDKEMNTMKKANDGIMELSDDQLESAAGGIVLSVRSGVYAVPDKNNWLHPFSSREEAKAFAKSIGQSDEIIIAPGIFI